MNETNTIIDFQQQQMWKHHNLLTRLCSLLFSGEFSGLSPKSVCCSTSRMAVAFRYNSLLLQTYAIPQSQHSYQAGGVAERL